MRFDQCKSCQSVFFEFFKLLCRKAGSRTTGRPAIALIFLCVFFIALIRIGIFFIRIILITVRCGRHHRRVILLVSHTVNHFIDSDFVVTDFLCLFDNFQNRGRTG